MVFVGTGLILALARLIGRPAWGDETPVGDPVAPPARGGWSAAAVVLAGAVLAAVGGLAGQTSNDAVSEVAPLGELPLTLHGWTGTELPLGDSVHDLLAPDAGVCRQYTNNVGQKVVVWVFFWRTGSTIIGYHHPSVCWGNKGYGTAEQWVEQVPTPGGAALAATAWEFQQARDKMVVVYWTQEGRRVWTDVDEKSAEAEMLASGWTGHEWVGALLGARGPAAGARLQVVVVAPGGGRAARRAAAGVATQVAADLYTLCPWAAPTGVKMDVGPLR